MKKKFIALFVVTSIALGTLVGCSGTKSNDTGSSGKEVEKSEVVKQEQVTLRFSWWGGDTRHEATLKAIEKYMSLHPNVKIEAEYGGFDGYQQKILTQISGGTAPDIMQLDSPWLPDLEAQGDTLVDLKTMSGLNVGGFDGKFLNDNCVYNDKLVGLPTGLNATTIIYNKDLYDEFNIPHDTVWDWENLLEVGKEVHRQNPEKYLIGADIQCVSLMLKAYVNQATGSQWVKDDYTMGFDKDTLSKGFTYIKDLVDSGVMERFEQLMLFSGKYQDSPSWTNKQAILSPQWVSVMSAYKKDDTFNLDTARFPIAKDHKTTAVIVRPSQVLSISNNSKNKEVAAEFLNWWYNDKEAIEILKDVRSVPPTAVGRETLAELNLIDPAVAKGIDVALENIGILEGKITTNAELEKIVQEEIEKVGFGKSTPEQAANDMIQAYTKKLNELKNQQ